MRLTIKDPDNLLSIVLDVDVTEADVAAIRTVLRIHDHSDEAPCYCAFQFPDAPWSLSKLWRDAQRRVGLAGSPTYYPGSARWVSQQPGYLLPEERSRERDEQVLDQLADLGIAFGERIPSDNRCPAVSSVTNQPCLLEAGHHQDSPMRFHKFAEPRSDDVDHSMMIANDTVD